MDSLLSFENIQEIKFTKVGNNIFSINIKSDINSNGEQLKDTVFEAKLCKIDSTLKLKCEKEYVDVQIHSDFTIKSESFSIPINIQLLLNQELNQFFNITKD